MSGKKKRKNKLYMMFPQGKTKIKIKKVKFY